MARKASLSDTITAALAPFGFPSAPGPGLCFRAEDEALLTRGFPFLRILTDEPAPKKAHAAVVAALDAIDPVLRIRVPRETARLYLLGYSVGPNLFVDRNHPPENAGLREERDALMRSDRQPDRALLEGTLRRIVCFMGDTYGRWRYREVLGLYEGFLGTDAVAETVSAYLLELARSPGLWGDFLWDDPRRANAAGNELAWALAWILRRTSPDAAARIRAALATAPSPESALPRGPRVFYLQLAWLADPSRTRIPGPSALHMAYCEDDAVFLRARQQHFGDKAFLELPARCIRVLGTDHLALPISLAGRDLTALMEQLSIFRDPGVVRVVAHVATQRKGMAPAGAFLREHAAYVRPILDALRSVDDPREQKAATAALALLDAVEAPKAPKSLTPAQVEAEIARIFEALGGALRSAPDDETRADAIRNAYACYAEARAAGGIVLPEAYFTHRFGDFGLGAYAMLAVDAIGT